MRDHVRGFGAWSAEEIAAWSDVECNALFIQMIAATMREGGLDDNPGEDEWRDYERRAEAGNCPGNIYRGDDGKVYYSLDL